MKLSMKSIGEKNTAFQNHEMGRKVHLKDMVLRALSATALALSISVA